MPVLWRCLPSGKQSRRSDIIECPGRDWGLAFRNAPPSHRFSKVRPPSPPLNRRRAEVHHAPNVQYACRPPQCRARRIQRRRSRRHDAFADVSFRAAARQQHAGTPPRVAATEQQKSARRGADREQPPPVEVPGPPTIHLSRVLLYDAPEQPSTVRAFRITTICTIPRH